MNRKHWKKICWMFALTIGLFELPAIVLASHGEDGDAVDTGMGLLFSIPGCDATESPGMALEP